jgi:hypothetical protein
VDWAAAFQSPEFCSGLQSVVADAIAKSTRAGSAREPEVATLEQLGEVRPSVMAPVVSAASTSEGMLSAPSFIGICGSTSVTQSSAVDTNISLNVSAPIYTSPIVSVEAISELNKAFIFGPSRPPSPAKTVAQIVAFKFVEMSDLIPENLEAPTNEVPSFAIEGRSIVPTTTTSPRKKNEIGDILTWVECFNSYVAVITSVRPERARDLLAYMALIIRIAKQFPGRCWYNYDRAFRLEAAASNMMNWSQIHPDLYHYHTSVAVQSTQPQARRYREPRGDQNSMTTCKSWNSGACSSPREFCRFRHRCDRNGCGGAHRRINCQELIRKRGRSPGEEPSWQRQAARD